MKRFLLCFAYSAIIAVAMRASLVFAQGPMVQYEITWIESALSEDIHGLNINNNKTVVGYFYDASGDPHAFVWSQETGFVNLNDIASVPVGWHLISAKGINESGQIAGNARNSTTSQTVAYRFDPDTGNADLMPFFDDSNHWVASYDPINEWGDVLYSANLTSNLSENYHAFVDTLDDELYVVRLTDYNKRGEPKIRGASAINDLRQFVGRGYRISLGATPDAPVNFEGFGSSFESIKAINNAGYFAGHVAKKVGKYNRAFASRFVESIDELGPESSSCYGINSITTTSNGDVCGTQNFPNESGGNRVRVGFVFMDEHGYLLLDNMVVGLDSDIDKWYSAVNIRPTMINDRDSTGFGAICGRAEMPDGTISGLLLTPVAPEPTPGITVTPTSGLVTTEGGDSDWFEVVLDTAPTEDVTIGISVSPSGTSEGTIDKTSLTFTSGNWSVPQPVTITGIDDEFDDGDVDYMIETSAAVSNDSDYHGLDPDDVSVTNLDDEGPLVYPSGDIGKKIPDNNSGVANSTIGVPDSIVITNLTVNLDISHPRPSDVRAYLTDPNGVQIRLLTIDGDNPVDDFDTSNALGPWTLDVYDVRKKKTGTLNRWSMTIE